MAELRLTLRARKLDYAITTACTIEAAPTFLVGIVALLRTYVEDLAAVEETDASFSQEMIAEVNGEPFASARPLPVLDQVQQHLRRMAEA